ncbi:hypothetical protein ACFL1R_04045 [Candidatus Latescibacterota bacterium]
MKTDIFIPDMKTKLSENHIWLWYKNISHELKLGLFSIPEIKYIGSNLYYKEASLLKKWRRPYVKKHFSDNFNCICDFLLSDNNSLNILDLGCGYGSESLLMAMKGLNITAISLDEIALNIFKKRLNFYQERVSYELKISTHLINAFDFDYSSISPIDGLFSLFAFNNMQPCENILELMSPHFSKRCKVALLDGNAHSIWPLLFPSRRRDYLTPKQVVSKLNELGFDKRELLGGIVLPPFVWAFGNNEILFKINKYLSKYLFLSASYLLLAEKR